MPSRKREFQLGQQEPRNAGEKLYFEKYGTVTPIPEQTLTRKNNIQVCCILYIHQGINLAEAARLNSIDIAWAERCRKSDRWDEFTQELAQLTRPSNLTLVKSHDIKTVAFEQERRERTLEDLRREESRALEEMKSCEAGSQQCQRCLAIITKLRELIGEITGYSNFQKEMSAARQAGLTAAAREAPGSTDSKRAKGKTLDI